MSALLKVSGLRAGYGRVPVLHGIDLSVNDGEILGILGHNGMGKSTLLKTLMGIIPASGGSMIFDGQDIGRQRSSGRAQLGIGYVPQGRGIFPNLSVRDNLRMGIAAHDLDEDAAIDRVLADFPRLERLLERDGGALSGGEQQLLALARCLVSEPDLILLDEPTEGIQPSIIDEIIDLLKELNRREGLSIVLVEQSLDFITALSDRVLLIQKGKIMGEVSGSEAADPALIEEFTGLGAGGGKTAKPASASGGMSAFSQDKSRPAAPPPHAARPGAATPAQRPAAAPAPLQERMSYMTVQRPTLSQMKAIVAELGMNMSDERVQEFLDVMQGTLDAYDIVDALPDYLPPVLYPRTSGYRPTPDENPMNAWYVKTEIKGAPRGPLLGRTVALKDNVCLAGVPMMNGASTLKGYTPDIDATIVTRLLDAGATITGKAHCEYFCLSGGSHTNATGAVHNPHKHGYSAGGSSSGSGALVGAGLVDMAIGGDQGGSIRMPASFCGVYGMKPTHGLVPYSGIMPIETTIDHTGPMTQNVMDNALMLEVIAGADGLDPRQYDVRTDKYTAAVNRGVSGLRIGVVKEGFGHPQSEADVDASVRAGAEMFRRLGATVDEISIPWHLHGPAIWTPIGLEGLTNQMMLGNGFGTGWEGLYTTSLLDYHSNWRSRADELSDTLKISMFVGQYHLKHTRGRYYAKAQNLARQLREEYNKVLASYDLLLMPTTPMKATPLPPADAPLALWTQRAFEMLPNTSPFDVTGHPAMSIPCGMSDGLPIGLQLIGRRYEESTIYRAAGAFEQAGDWRKM
ncbi:MAG: amidase [Rhodobacterales bacterium]|nr:amidase [Rhodobacterales bacterium]MDX5391532.1 amidase [Rhodobacterales bacterium]MDX5491232.1 amidase [Rhodobacterales bacterium]